MCVILSSSRVSCGHCCVVCFAFVLCLVWPLLCCVFCLRPVSCVAIVVLCVLPSSCVCVAIVDGVSGLSAPSVSSNVYVGNTINPIKT